jgi:hypothetical protein
MIPARRLRAPGARRKDAQQFGARKSLFALGDARFDGVARRRVRDKNRQAVQTSDAFTAQRKTVDSERY